MPLHVSSTVVLIIRRSKLYYTASGIITPVGGRPVHRLREDSLNLCTGRPENLTGTGYLEGAIETSHSKTQNKG